MKRRQLKSPVFQGRRLFLMLTLLLVIGVLMLRAVWLEVFQQQWLQHQADKRQTRVMVVPASRGEVVDRNGEPMAVSSPSEALWCNPRELLKAREELRDDYDLSKRVADATAANSSDKGIQTNAVAGTRFAQLEESFRQIEKEMEMPEGELLKRLDAARSKSFVYLGRQLTPELADKVLALDLPGVGSSPEFRRFYPSTETAGHILGMANTDGIGIEGIEKAKNDWLAGKNGKKRVVIDAKGKPVENVERIEDMLPGQPVQLSIDQRIQYIAYKELKTRVSELKAQAGSLVVLDAHTGEILAMANVPSFNPNSRKVISPDRRRNRAVTDKAEPGSTIKPLTIAAALESRVIGPEVEIDTSPGRINFGKYQVTDIRNNGVIGLSQILARSSNVGAARVSLLMTPRDHWMFLSRVGFGLAPGSGFPGETAGELKNYTEWTQVDHASHGYGYSLSVSLLQLAHAYTPFAADGVLMPATIYKLNGQVGGQQVMSPETAHAVLHMMEAVVQTGGTGQKALVEGYHVAGKTGTARKYINGAYRDDRFMTSFIGIAPATRPRLVVAVQIDEPQMADSGGLAAAPVFSKVMAESLRLLDVPPDDLPDVKKTEQQTPPVPPPKPAAPAVGGAP